MSDHPSTAVNKIHAKTAYITAIASKNISATNITIQPSLSTPWSKPWTSQGVRYDSERHIHDDADEEQFYEYHDSTLLIHHAHHHKPL